MTLEQMITLNTQFTKLMTDTQAVITLRMMGMAGALPSEAGENERMISEKGPAFSQAVSDMTAAAMAGKRPDQVMAAGMSLLQQQVSNNRTRLSE
jgi:hypothetical protein